MERFEHGGHQLAYSVYGEGPRACVLLPGLLFSQRLQAPLARVLAKRGNRVITLDPLGHGASDRPRDMTQYSMPIFAEQTVGLLDHLGIEQAVVGGVSLGANITLEVAALAPERVRAMVIEMPVLDNALLASALAFTPLLVGLTLGEPLAVRAAAVLRRVPRRGLPPLADVMLDWLGQEPGPSGAVLQGLFFGRIAPPRSLRRTFEAPALVIGHPRDPVHPFSDADALARELPNARLVDANSIFERQLSPSRLNEAVGEFVDDAWPARRSTAAGARKQRAAGVG